MSVELVLVAAASALPAESMIPASIRIDFLVVVFILQLLYSSNILKY
jgi:hypothetical protein